MQDYTPPAILQIPVSTSMNYDQGQATKGISAICLRAISSEELFKEALGDLYSHRYLMQNQNQFGKILFIFEIKSQQRSWGLFKDDRELQGYLKQNHNYQALSSATRESLSKIETCQLEEQGTIAQNALTEVLKKNSEELKEQFFQTEREGYGKFMMKKRSGGRYKESTCCKFGAIFQRWKQRQVVIFLKGVAYYNEKGQVREFLSFSHGFHFQFGKPSTGLELGLTLFANNRQLSLEARSVKDFIYLLFTLRSACKESCYMSLNRFNSFAPLRYASSGKFFVDGQDYFEALFSALDSAASSILMMGWMISPEFLLKRQSQKITLQDVLKKASSKGVVVKIILYHQTCFLSNGSQYCKNKLEQYKNITVLSHPCGKLPVLWSHHGKIVIVDEKEAFIGGLDICYGRFDKPSHELYPPANQYPGLEHNNVRKNDQWDVKYPNQLGISRHECRLPWHDVSQSIKGDAVPDLAHHFYQMWNFVRYENQLQPHDSYAPSMFQTDVKTAFSTKILPIEESQLTSDSGIFKKIQNRVNTIKNKGKNFIKEVKTKIVGEEKRQSRSSIRLSVTQDYFEKYLKEIASEIEQKKNASISRSIGKKNSRARNSGSRSSRYSAEEVKKVKQTIKVDPIKEGGPQKTNSFLLTGNKVLDFMSVEIDKDYVQCLERVKNRMKPSQEDGEVRQIDSDEENSAQGSGALGDRSLQISDGRDQCQVVRSVGNWSIGCHSANTQFSIHIAYLQLISQAKHYIYIQNQFFISSLANTKLVHNEIAESIYLRVKKAIQKNEKFIVYVVLPLIPGFAGDLEVEDCLLLRKEMQWQYDTICRGQDSLWQKLLNHTNDPGKYIQFMGLRKHGKLNPDWIPQTEIIYVHSKLMIVDDQTVICGSANINDRSLVGDRDSEIAVITRGEDFVEGKMDGEPALVSQMAQELRVKLWMEHFGFSEEEALDPISEETSELIVQRAAKNTRLYRRIFGCYPDDEMATRKDIESKRKESDIQLYDELSSQIIGHVVEFPLRFLQEEPLTCLMTEKEFYVPTECLT